jgi:RNA polymerase sigma-70 factor (ECF subfamily)
LSHDQDRQRIRGYLEGCDASVGEIQGWIRREMEICYPVLRQEMDDVCQVVHSKLLQNLRAGSFQGRSTLKTYVGRITHHTAIDWLRKRSRERSVTDAWLMQAQTSGANPYRSLVADQEYRLIHQVLLRSPAACRSLWRMVFLERLSYAEIARRLQVPEGTVKSRAWHCRRKALALLARLRRQARRGRG